jgi:S1-C subfamily serine protease
LQVGERVFAIGAPEGLDLTLSEGIISRLEVWKPEGVPDAESMVEQIQTTAAISPGSSGGGLFDQAGRLIGITTSSIRGAQNLNFAIPVSDVQSLVDRMHLQQLSDDK